MTINPVERAFNNPKNVLRDSRGYAYFTRRGEVVNFLLLGALGRRIDREGAVASLQRFSRLMQQTNTTELTQPTNK